MLFKRMLQDAGAVAVLNPCVLHNLPPVVAGAETAVAGITALPIPALL